MLVKSTYKCLSSVQCSLTSESSKNNIKQPQPMACFIFPIPALFLLGHWGGDSIIKDLQTFLAISGAKNHQKPFWRIQGPEISKCWRFPVPEIVPFRRFPVPDLSKSLGSLWNMKVQDLIILNISSLVSNERS